MVTITKTITRTIVVKPGVPGVYRNVPTGTTTGTTTSSSSNLEVKYYKDDGTPVYGRKDTPAKVPIGATPREGYAGAITRQREGGGTVTITAGGKVTERDARGNIIKQYDVPRTEAGKAVKEEISRARLERGTLKKPLETKTVTTTTGPELGKREELTKETLKPEKKAEKPVIDFGPVRQSPPKEPSVTLVEPKMPTESVFKAPKEWAKYYYQSVSGRGKREHSPTTGFPSSTSFQPTYTTKGLYPTQLGGGFGLIPILESETISKTLETSAKRSIQMLFGEDPFEKALRESTTEILAKREEKAEELRKQAGEKVLLAEAKVKLEELKSQRDYNVYFKNLQASVTAGKIPVSEAERRLTSFEKTIIQRVERKVDIQTEDYSRYMQRTQEELVFTEEQFNKELKKSLKEKGMGTGKQIWESSKSSAELAVPVATYHLLSQPAGAILGTKILSEFGAELLLGKGPTKVATESYEGFKSTAEVAPAYAYTQAAILAAVLVSGSKKFEKKASKFRDATRQKIIDIAYKGKSWARQQPFLLRTEGIGENLIFKDISASKGGKVVDIYKGEGQISYAIKNLLTQEKALYMYEPLVEGGLKTYGKRTAGFEAKIGGRLKEIETFEKARKGKIVPDQSLLDLSQVKADFPFEGYVSGVVQRGKRQTLSYQAVWDVSSKRPTAGLLEGPLGSIRQGMRPERFVPHGAGAIYIPAEKPYPTLPQYTRGVGDVKGFMRYTKDIIATTTKGDLKTQIGKIRYVDIGQTTSRFVKPSLEPSQPFTTWQKSILEQKPSVRMSAEYPFGEYRYGQKTIYSPDFGRFIPVAQLPGKVSRFIKPKKAGPYGMGEVTQTSAYGESIYEAIYNLKRREGTTKTVTDLTGFGKEQFMLDIRQPAREIQFDIQKPTKKTYYLTEPIKGTMPIDIDLIFKEKTKYAGIRDRGFIGMATFGSKPEHFTIWVDPKKIKRMGYPKEQIRLTEWHEQGHVLDRQTHAWWKVGNELVKSSLEPPSILLKRLEKQYIKKTTYEKADVPSEIVAEGYAIHKIIESGEKLNKRGKMYYNILKRKGVFEKLGEGEKALSEAFGTYTIYPSPAYKPPLKTTRVTKLKKPTPSFKSVETSPMINELIQKQKVKVKTTPPEVKTAVKQSIRRSTINAGEQLSKQLMIEKGKIKQPQTGEQIMGGKLKETPKTVQPLKLFQRSKQTTTSTFRGLGFRQSPTTLTSLKRAQLQSPTMMFDEKTLQKQALSSKQIIDEVTIQKPKQDIKTFFKPITFTPPTTVPPPPITIIPFIKVPPGVPLIIPPFPFGGKPKKGAFMGGIQPKKYRQSFAFFALGLKGQKKVAKRLSKRKLTGLEIRPKL